jgi:hypothetical protein
MPPTNTAAQLSYQICPIVLTGGIATQLPGAILPFLSLMWPSGSTLNLGDTPSMDDLDEAFGAFNVLPGGTLVTQTIGKYPFANQYVAANAVIHEPLIISVIMDAPLRLPASLVGGGVSAWELKHTIMTNLKTQLDNHNNSGGLYTIVTPAYMYQNCVMSALTDNSRGNNSLPQNAWRFDFERPLVALPELSGIQNQFTQKLSNGLQTPGNITGLQPGSSQGQIETAGDQSQSIAGIVSGGNTPAIFSPSSPVMQFPVQVPQGGFAFSGIS